MHSGDYVRAGQSLIDGPLVPHDILRISGEEAVQQYLVHEVQGVYRSQRVEINDKHIEIIIARMLRKVQIENPGDTSLLPGSVMDKFDFRKVNENLSKCLKITEKGDSDFEVGHDRPQGGLGRGQLEDRIAGRRTSQGDATQTGDRQHAIARDHQGGRAEFQFHFGRQLPGNDQSAHRSSLGRQDRQSGRPQGKRDPGPPDSGRNRIPHVPGIGSPNSPRGPGGAGGAKGSHAGLQLPVAGIGSGWQRCVGHHDESLSTADAVSRAAAASLGRQLTDLASLLGGAGGGGGQHGGTTSELDTGGVMESRLPRGRGTQVTT